MVLEDQIIHADSGCVLPYILTQSIDLIVTDPPYGVGYCSNKQNYDTRGSEVVKKERPAYFEKIEGDSELPVDWLIDAYRILKDNSAIYIFCHWTKWPALVVAVQQVGFHVKNMIVLAKSNHGMGDLDGAFAPQHELLLYATKGRHLLSHPQGRLNDVWNVSVNYSGAKRYHPNEKPVSWIEPAIRSSSKRGDLVLDPFAGSGTTGVAAMKFGRKYCLIEIDSEHVKTIRSRIADL